MTPYSYSLYLLSRRNYFEAELWKILAEKFLDDLDSVGETISTLKESGYLDDERTLVSYVRYQVGMGHGQYYIRDKLRQKGVESSIQAIDRVIEAEELDLDEVLRGLVQKYIGRNRKKSEQMLVKSCATYLGGRGFVISVVFKIIKEVIRDEGNFSERC
jgi:SOS response regulatory protein OraA/RecX